MSEAGDRGSPSPAGLQLMTVPPPVSGTSPLPASSLLCWPLHVSAAARCRQKLKIVEQDEGGLHREELSTGSLPLSKTTQVKVLSACGVQRVGLCVLGLNTLDTVLKEVLLLNAPLAVFDAL